MARALVDTENSVSLFFCCPQTQKPHAEAVAKPPHQHYFEILAEDISNPFFSIKTSLTIEQINPFETTSNDFPLGHDFLHSCLLQFMATGKDGDLFWL